MKEFFESYQHLKQYPEFDIDKIEEKYGNFIEHDEQSGEGGTEIPPWVFNPTLAFEYVMLAYAPDSSLAKIKDHAVRKEKAIVDSKIPKDQRAKILRNENPMIGDMVTRLFREINDLDYELLISGKEAIETLLEVVRKPIDTNLQDDKERNAVKAKRECFEDAQALLKEIRKIYNQMHDIDSDMAEHVGDLVFRGGTAERLALLTKKK